MKSAESHSPWHFSYSTSAIGASTSSSIRISAMKQTPDTCSSRVFIGYRHWLGLAEWRIRIFALCYIECNHYSFWQPWCRSGCNSNLYTRDYQPNALWLALIRAYLFLYLFGLTDPLFLSAIRLHLSTIVHQFLTLSLVLSGFHTQSKTLFPQCVPMQGQSQSDKDWTFSVKMNIRLRDVPFLGW